MRNYKSASNGLNALWFASCLALSTFAHAAEPANRVQPFEWKSSEPLIRPPADAKDIFGVKDPTIVHHDGRYHVFMTTAGKNGWGMAYTSFANWEDAPKASLFMLDKSPIGPGYRAAPQVFYFAPQKLWYLIYQGGDPLYSTTKDINDPQSWTAPQPFYKTIPASVKDAKGQAAWLDFWIICDDNKCHLFFTDDNGSFYRGETTVARFPQGFSEPVIAMKEKREDLFEASNTYKIAGTSQYLTLVEAMGPKGRYFRAWTADRLDGQWQPIPGSSMNMFAGADNMKFDGRVWSEGASHGELVRAGVDQTLTIDPCKPLRFLYQGLDMEKGKHYEYIELPYRLGLITATGPNAISALCTK
ncbi:MULTISPECIES: non-reducing end alpha-L-arabinofuranosidase family hydrolase [Roseateles]|uniref:Alpha-L-arabinofuranosidase n=1 Tax=Pelomonas aquatica TaxID=431058 RepID=A0ABU1ZH42_9BURK|nr:MULTISPECIES: non-reducing end alpha-L-arabinofuranosidase family hydrolase [Roseateles]KQY80095.1 glycoside hydrolase [Pelomonas sp. Root1444]MDR7299798.1 endo-1,4-beta-xylanase [Pelomonas aquatica]